METNDIEKMIKKNLNTSPPGIGIDIRQETMARIEAYEKRKDKMRNFLVWVISIFTFCAGLASIWIFEGFLGLYADFFLRHSLDMTVVRIVFQGTFLVFVLISLTVMISQVKPVRSIHLLFFT